MTDLLTFQFQYGVYFTNEFCQTWIIFFNFLRLTFLSIGDNEHGFSLRWSAFQSGGVIQALIAKTIMEVTPSRSPVRINLYTVACLIFYLHFRAWSLVLWLMSRAHFGLRVKNPTTLSWASWQKLVVLWMSWLLPLSVLLSVLPSTMHRVSKSEPLSIIGWSLTVYDSCRPGDRYLPWW